MADIYCKRDSIVSAEPFDPTRTDQGVTVNLDDSGALLSYTMVSRGRLVGVKPGDWIVTDPNCLYPISDISFFAMFQLLSDVVAPDDGAITQTGGNQ